MLIYFVAFHTALQSSCDSMSTCFQYISTNNLSLSLKNKHGGVQSANVKGSKCKVKKKRGWSHEDYIHLLCYGVSVAARISVAARHSGHRCDPLRQKPCLTPDHSHSWKLVSVWLMENHKCKHFTFPLLHHLIQQLSYRKQLCQPWLHISTIYYSEIHTSHRLTLTSLLSLLFPSFP